MSRPISVCIACRNEADRLADCLASVAWADQLVVMDLESTDDSAAIAAAHGALVVSRTAVPLVEMVRNEIADHATGDWIIVLDPDERLSPALEPELRRVAERDDVDAVIIPRMNHDLGYPPSNPHERYEPQLRMYRRSAVRWPTVPNALPVVPEERLYRVPARDDLVMIHDRNRNVPEIVDRIYRIAELQAQSMIDRGQRFSAQAMAGALGGRAYRQFVVGRAWRDGVPGMFRAAILVGFHFYIWVAFWQLSGARRTAGDDRYVRRLGLAMEALRRVVVVGGIPRRVARRIMALVARH